MFLDSFGTKYVRTPKLKQHIGTGEHDDCVQKRSEALTFSYSHKMEPLVIVTGEDFMSIAAKSEYLNLSGCSLYSLFITKERLIWILPGWHKVREPGNRVP